MLIRIGLAVAILLFLYFEMRYRVIFLLLRLFGTLPVLLIHYEVHLLRCADQTFEHGRVLLLFLPCQIDAAPDSSVILFEPVEALDVYLNEHFNIEYFICVLFIKNVLSFVAFTIEFHSSLKIS